MKPVGLGHVDDSDAISEELAKEVSPKAIPLGIVYPLDDEIKFNICKTSHRVNLQHVHRVFRCCGFSARSRPTKLRATLQLWEGGSPFIQDLISFLQLATLGSKSAATLTLRVLKPSDSMIVVVAACAAFIITTLLGQKLIGRS